MRGVAERLEQDDSVALALVLWAFAELSTDVVTAWLFVVAATTLAVRIIVERDRLHPR